MPDATDIVEPKDDAQAAPPVESQQPADGGAPDESAAEASLPPDLLNMPTMQAVFAGSPAAVSIPLAAFKRHPQAKQILDNMDLLQKAGMGFYRSLSGERDAIFNQFYLHPEEIKAADRAGKLLQIAPDYKSVETAVMRSGLTHPSLHAQNPKAALKSAPLLPPPQFATGNAAAPPASSSANIPMTAPTSPVPQVPPPSAATQRKLATARTSALTPQAPTAGASPGAGRLLNSILKPVI